MPVKLQPTTVAAYVVVTVVAAALGLWLGRPRDKVSATISSVPPVSTDTLTLQKWLKWHDSLAQVFREEVVGIEVGRTFPDVAISPFDDDSVLRIREILPQGGVLALVNGECDKCIETAVALQDAVDSAGSAAYPTVLLADQSEGVLPFAGQLARRGVRIPLYRDRETALRTRHRVLGTMPWFRLDEQSRLISFGFVFVPNRARLREIVSVDNAIDTTEDQRHAFSSQERR